MYAGHVPQTQLKAIGSILFWFIAAPLWQTRHTYDGYGEESKQMDATAAEKTWLSLYKCGWDKSTFIVQAYTCMLRFYVS